MANIKKSAPKAVKPKVEEIKLPVEEVKIPKETIKVVKETVKEPEIKPVTSIRVCGQDIEGKVVGNSFVTDSGVTYALPE